MKRSKFTEQQIAFALKQAELGTTVEVVAQLVSNQKEVVVKNSLFFIWCVLQV
jgi:hypothetical protein